MAIEVDVPKDQEEHELISTSLDVEQLDTNLFRSRSLWIPRSARGVFGGQVVSQALVSATNSVDSKYALHSLHCYFLLSASSTVPILYYVERLREGRSYTTRSVKAVQSGQTIFILMCSFQVPEPRQPSHSWPMPLVPKPEDCPSQEEVYAQLAASTQDPVKKARYLGVIQDRKRSPIAIKIVLDTPTPPDRSKIYMFWMKAKNIPKYEPAYQKCILAYVSDLLFISTASKTLGLSYGRGPNTIAMQSSLDHSMYFYNQSFDHGDWMLYVNESPTTGSGRGVVHGRVYDRHGNLCAIASQEGVVRTDHRDVPVESTKGKL
ncbi:Thioesterase/thiol ester dehydrase-isomerase [Sistotremastrum niveocremeum HHB9708]|uniref:Thioesterase/thiol ester dehydrase-isomerase n=1 Tax=Sistotremastrum niveocremeum HHB9708 TaxID=1314777 RepID=A0A164UIP1_9AGAM|nr:Thioesterase/thiol ester dehydrase-isomerase [Sistotremastrum niveocremeum HHB9708]